MKHMSSILSFDMDREEIRDITDDVEKLLTDKESGFVIITVLHTTAALFVNENESGLLKDVRKAFERIAPSSEAYEHNKWGEGNGKSHIRAIFLHPSLVLPISKGNIVKGVWQRIFLVNLDIEKRKRDVRIDIYEVE